MIIGIDKVIRVVLQNEQNCPQCNWRTARLFKVVETYPGVCGDCFANGLAAHGLYIAVVDTKNGVIK